MRALLVHSVLPACSRLHELELHLYNMQHTSFGLEGWAANLPHLRCLTVVNNNEAPVTAQLRGLTRMHELTLYGHPLTFSGGAVLPPSLTTLTLSGLQGTHLPQQVGQGAVVWGTRFADWQVGLTVQKW